MQIDVTNQIDLAIEATAKWAADVGFVPPDEVPESTLSKKARDLHRILNASAFGCQQRNVKMLLEVLIDEKLPEVRGDSQPFTYSHPHVGFRQGTILVPADRIDIDETVRPQRPGMMLRVSKSGNVGLRYSNGEYAPQYHGMGSVRPATEQEIRDYFAEFYGVQISPFDTIEADDEELPAEGDF